jgi:prevent-host-death family protein
MDRFITATEANQRFSEVLRDVRDGESFTVTSHGKPVARVTPFEVDGADRVAKVHALLAQVQGRSIQITGPWTRNDLYDDE